MKKFNVIIYEPNSKRFESYNVIPYFVNEYQEIKKKPKTFDEFKDFVKSKSVYQFWARCEYEIVLVDWPCQQVADKWDVHRQIMMNLDIVTSILMQELKIK